MSYACSECVHIRYTECMRTAYLLGGHADGRIFEHGATAGNFIHTLEWHFNPQVFQEQMTGSELLPMQETEHIYAPTGIEIFSEYGVFSGAQPEVTVEAVGEHYRAVSYECIKCHTLSETGLIKHITGQVGEFYCLTCIARAEESRLNMRSTS